MREKRKACGYGPREFAFRICELPSTLAAIENGKRPPWTCPAMLCVVADRLSLLGFHDAERERFLQLAWEAHEQWGRRP